MARNTRKRTPAAEDAAPAKKADSKDTKKADPKDTSDTAPVSPLAQGAHRDANPDPDTSGAPETGDDYAKGQASNPGQVAPEGDPVNQTAAVHGGTGDDDSGSDDANDDNRGGDGGGDDGGGQNLGADEASEDRPMVPAPMSPLAQGAHRDADPDSPSPETGDDYAKGQASNPGQVAPLDGNTPTAATAAGVTTLGVGPAPAAAPLDPPPQVEPKDGSAPRATTLNDAGAMAATNDAGQLIGVDGETPDADSLFAPLFEGRGDVQVCQVRLLQRTGPITQLVLPKGAQVSTAQAEVIAARVRTEAGA